MEQKVKQFKDHYLKVKAYQHAMGILHYDSETAMPKSGSEGLGATIGILSEELYKLNTSEEFKTLLKELFENKDKLEYTTRREVEEYYEEILRMEKIPMQEYTEYQQVQFAANMAWHDAKVNNDYASFEPHLSKIFEFQRRFAGYTRPEMEPYNALLADYEKGLSTQMLDEYFANVKEKLVPVIHAIIKKGVQFDSTPFEKSFPIWKQRIFSEYLMDVMHIDKNCCVLGEVEHPFTLNLNKRDVRLTTHYHENMMLSNLFSVIHEGGHSIYELNIGEDLFNSPLGSGVSMSIHESQSRFFENIIGRSREFIELIYPKICELFPEQMQGVTADQLYLAANKAEPSLIRTEADELTYSLHIMIRYELEKRLVAGTLSTKDLPAEWNRLYKEYLGIDVPNDAEGVLQDSHWGGGLVAYFPSYSLGSAYASQLYAAMEKDLDIPTLIKNGELNIIVEWLTERIYKFGALKTPSELIADATGETLNPKFYTDYLTDKYKKLYDIN